VFKGNRKYYAFVILSLALAVTVQYLQPKEISWHKTYMRSDRIPFGSYAIYELLTPALFADKEVNRIPLYNLAGSTKEGGNSLLIINDDFDPSKLDLKALFSFIEQGNAVLISANTFGAGIQDTFKLKTGLAWFKDSQPLDSLLHQRQSFTLSFLRGNSKTRKQYSYTTAATATYFSSFDTTRFRIASMDQDSNVVLLHAQLGRGQLYLSSVPDVFANFYVVNHPNRQYAYQVLSLLAGETLIWDEYYKRWNHREESPFRFIFNNPGLYAAYSLLLLSLLLFMFFGLRRRQRPIPIVLPLQNTTLQFVDVVSHVYFKSANHQHIAAEKIRYFYAGIRKKYNLSTEQIDDEFLNHLAALSGVAYDDLERIFYTCERLRHAPTATEPDLLELSKWINYFNTKSIR